MLNKYIEELKKIKLLSLDEEKVLWSKIASGDEEARNQLVLSYQPLVFKTALGFSIKEEQLLELVQEGVVGLMEAVDRFEPSRGVAFSLFAIHRIKGRMLDYLKKSSSSGVLCLDYPLSETDTLLDRLVATDAGPEELAEENFLVAKVKQAIDSLPEKEQKVLEGIYLEDMSPDKMAQVIDVSRTHIYRLQKQGVKRVRGMLSKFIHDLKW